MISHAGENEDTDARTPLLRYLDSIGSRLDVYPPDFGPHTPPSASVALLYRLDDPAKLSAASAAAFPVATARRPAWGCYGTMSYYDWQAATAARAVVAGE